MHLNIRMTYQTLLITIILTLISCGSDECLSCIQFIEDNQEEVLECRGLANNADNEPWTILERNILGEFCIEEERNMLIESLTSSESFTEETSCLRTIRSRVVCQ